MHPPVGQLLRRVTKAYQVPGTDIVLPKGLTVFIPIYAIHRDPEIYAEPNVFKPERFASDQMADQNYLQFLSFGHGPRNCIGLRFGLMQTRIGLMTILLKYQIEVCDQTIDSMEYSVNNIMMVPKEGVYLKLVRL